MVKKYSKCLFPQPEGGNSYIFVYCHSPNIPESGRWEQLNLPIPSAGLCAKLLIHDVVWAALHRYVRVKVV